MLPTHTMFHPYAPWISFGSQFVRGGAGSGHGVTMATTTLQTNNKKLSIMAPTHVMFPQPSDTGLVVGACLVIRPIHV